MSNPPDPNAPPRADQNEHTEDDGPLHIRIGMVGCGHIGAELVHQVMERAKILEDSGFAHLQITRIAVRDVGITRPDWVPRDLITDNPMDVAADPDIDMFVELAGGVEPARQWVEAALHTGKPVVTANKALMAECGGELLSLAARLGLPLRYEASVGGGIPILRAIESGLAATRLDEIAGVINGTTNYILTQMEEAGVTFQQALADAQRLGYAEADPTLDVEGIDAAQKLVILTGLAFGVEVPMEAIPVKGITGITRDYMKEQHELGHSIRLVARARRGENGKPPVLSVMPEALPSAHSLARIAGVTNGIMLVGQPLGEVVLAGPGAGPGPTASAVLSDILDASRPGAWPSRTWREIKSITRYRGVGGETTRSVARVQS